MVFENKPNFLCRTFHPDNTILISIHVVFGRNVQQPLVCFRVQATGNTQKQTGRIDTVFIVTQIQIKTTHTINISLPACVCHIKTFRFLRMSDQVSQRKHPAFRKAELLCYECVERCFHIVLAVLSD